MQVFQKTSCLNQEKKLELLAAPQIQMKKRLPLSKGTMLQSRYRILRQLGQGGMGAVYEAADGRFKNRSVALKETYADSDETRRAFQREAQLLANTEHEAFPRVIDYFAEAEGCFLVMELIRGTDLADLLEEQVEPFEQEKVLAWTDQILDALDDLHSNRIIHRDIKPSNLKLTPKGRLKLLDFGIAKGSIESDTTKYTTVGSLAAATFEYAPLEQVLKAKIDWFSALSVNYPEKTAAILQRSTDAPSDLYALSATLYQLLTKRLPVNAPTRALAIWAGQVDKMRPAHELNARVSPLVSTFLQKGLELDRKDRFHSAREMREALKKIVLTLTGKSTISKDFDKKLRIIPEIARPFLADEKGGDSKTPDKPKSQNSVIDRPTVETIQSKKLSENDSSGKSKEDEKSEVKIDPLNIPLEIILPSKARGQESITEIPAKIQLKEKTPVFYRTLAQRKPDLGGENKDDSPPPPGRGKRLLIDTTRSELSFEPKLLFQNEAFYERSHRMLTAWASVGVITILGVAIGMATFQQSPPPSASSSVTSRQEIKDSTRSAQRPVSQPPVISTKQKSLPAPNTTLTDSAKKTFSSTEKTGETPIKKTEEAETQETQTQMPAIDVKRHQRRGRQAAINSKNGKPRPVHNSDCIFNGEC